MSILGNIAGTAATSALGIGLGQIGRNQQMKDQNELMNNQMNNQMQLNKQMQDIQMQNWEKTNYSAQMEQMKKAGLNPALMYGQGGAGGQLAGGSGGGASGGNAPVNTLSQGMAVGLQAGQQMANIELMKAQAEKLRADTEKTRGVDTQEATQRIGTGGSQQKGIELDNALKSGNMETALKMAGQMLENEKARNISLVNDGKISGSDAKVRDKQNSVEILNKIMNTTQISESIKQKWNDLKIAQQNANTNSKNADTGYVNYLQSVQKNKIEEFRADLQSEYPGVWNTVGKAINDFIGIGDEDKGDKNYRTVEQSKRMW